MQTLLDNARSKANDVNMTFNVQGSIAKEKERAEKLKATLDKGLKFGDIKGSLKIGETVNDLLKKAAAKAGEK